MQGAPSAIRRQKVSKHEGWQSPKSCSFPSRRTEEERKGKLSGRWKNSRYPGQTHRKGGNHELKTSAKVDLCGRGGLKYWSFLRPHLKCSHDRQRKSSSFFFMQSSSEATAPHVLNAFQTWRPGISRLLPALRCPLLRSTTELPEHRLTWAHSWRWRCNGAGKTGCCERWWRSSAPRPSHLVWPGNDNI